MKYNKDYNEDDLVFDISDEKLLEIANENRHNDLVKLLKELILSIKNNDTADEISQSIKSNSQALQDFVKEVKLVGSKNHNLELTELLKKSDDLKQTQETTNSLFEKLIENEAKKPVGLKVKRDKFTELINYIEIIYNQ